MLDHQPVRAVIYLIRGHHSIEAAGAECLAYCEARGYQIAGLVVDGECGRRWSDGVIAMLAAGDADVIVVYDRADLPPHRRPRLEAVLDRQPLDGGSYLRRRRVRPSVLDR